MELMRHLPWKVYHDEHHVEIFQQAVQQELNLLQKSRDDLYLQFRPSTATWGMDEFEREYAIPTDRTRPMEERRRRWRAKRRGRGTTTVELVRRVSESFCNGPANVLEYPREHRFEIRMSNMTGEPPNFQDLKNVLEEIKPAHLAMYMTNVTHVWPKVYAAALAHSRTSGVFLKEGSKSNRHGVSLYAGGVTGFYRHQRIGGVQNYG